MTNNGYQYKTELTKYVMFINRYIDKKRLEGNREATRRRKSKKDRQQNGEGKSIKLKNDLPKITHKSK